MTNGYCGLVPYDSLLMDILRNDDPVNTNRSISEFTSTLTNSKIVAQDICNVGCKLFDYLTYQKIKESMNIDHEGVSSFIAGDKIIIYLKHCTEVPMNNFVTVVNGETVSNQNTNLNTTKVETRIESKVYKLQFNITSDAVENRVNRWVSGKSTSTTYGSDQVFMYDNNACEGIFGSDSSFYPYKYINLNEYSHDFSTNNNSYTNSSYDIKTALTEVFDVDYELCFDKIMGNNFL